VTPLQRFGECVRDKREARGWTQEELGARCGLDRSYIGGIERGERNISLTNLLKVARGLGVSPADLLEEDEA
jgi:transcriptional regulator with XRE-family HTH domain